VLAFAVVVVVMVVVEDVAVSFGKAFCCWNCQNADAAPSVVGGGFASVFTPTLSGVVMGEDEDALVVVVVVDGLVDFGLSFSLIFKLNYCFFTVVLSVGSTELLLLLLLFEMLLLLLLVLVLLLVGVTDNCNEKVDR
jgi:hypothetical protein